MLHDSLKIATRSYHDRLEASMYVREIMDGSLSFAQYKHLLNTNFRVHAQVEDALFGLIPTDIAHALELPLRRKMPALQKDAKEAGLDVSQAGYELPPVRFLTNEAAAIGALYVLEGATLGGHMIAGKLKTNRQLEEYNLGYHYYQVYGNSPGSRWKAFCSMLGDQPENMTAEYVAGACSMFNYMRVAHLALSGISGQVSGISSQLAGVSGQM